MTSEAEPAGAAALTKPEPAGTVPLPEVTGGAVNVYKKSDAVRIVNPSRRCSHLLGLCAVVEEVHPDGTIDVRPYGLAKTVPVKHGWLEPSTVTEVQALGEAKLFPDNGAPLLRAALSEPDIIIENRFPRSLGAGRGGPADLSEREGFAPVETTVVTVRYFHPDAGTPDGMVEYAQTVPLDRVHRIIEVLDEVAE